jgi:chemotaxis protein methyltransferase CheR
MGIKENTSREFRFTEKDFNKLRKIANAHTGIIVTDDKYDMYYSRLVKRLRKLGLKSFSEYVDYLDRNQDTEFTPFIDSITTNLTSFFRENHHFDYIKSNIVPDLLGRNDMGRELRVWSAGCSTGEEPYTIAMTLHEVMDGKTHVKPKITATDIDTTVLNKAASGIYDLARLEGLPNSIKRRWFFKGKGDKAGLVKVSPELRGSIDFRQLNLISQWSIREKYHIIFCRNVVIYFDRPTKTKLLNRFADQLEPGGYMILGHSESLQGLSDRFETVGKTIYKVR